MSTPPDWTTYSKHGYSFSYPAAWKLTERADKNGPVVVVEGPKVTGGLPLQVVAVSQQPYTGDLKGLIAAFEALRTLPSEVKVKDEPMAIPGATDAQLTERTFVAPTTDGAKVPSRVLELRLVAPQQLSVGFLVRTADTDFAGSPLRQVFATFKVG